MQKILIIEDDLDICELLTNFLREEQYDLICSYDGRDGIQCFESQDFDLVLLDIMLPKRNGLEVLQEIRKHSITPIMIISAKSEEFDKSVMLGSGADDYMTKPFSLVELNARIKALLRRSYEYSKPAEEDILPSSLQFKDLILDKANHIISKNNQELNLTATEFDLLALFLEHPSRVFTKENLYSLIWEDTYMGDENIVNVHMSRLRNKIEDNAKQPKYIETLWGIGYRLGKDHD